MAAEVCLSASLSYLKESLTCRKILQREANSFTSLQKEVVLRICIAVKSTSLSAGTETANTGSSDKQKNLHTTDE
jgi:hypothetical protein